MPDPQKLTAADWESAVPLSPSDWAGAQTVRQAPGPLTRQGPPTDAPAIGSGLRSSLQHGVLTFLSGINPAAQAQGLVDTAVDAAQGAPNYRSQTEGLFNQARDAFHKGDYVTASSKFVDYLLNGVPGLGASIDSVQKMGEQGDYSGMVGGSAALGVNVSSPALINRALPDVGVSAAQTRQLGATMARSPMDAQAVSDIIKAVPPKASAPYDPADLARARNYLAAEHQQMPIDSVEGLRDAADSGIATIEQRVSSYVAANPTDLIRTDPIAAIKAAFKDNQRSDALQQGLKDVASFNLDQPLTVSRADQIRAQLNAENKAILKRNNYDVATARSADPGFAAREAASAALRDGIYDQLEERGIQGVRELRRDEGSLIKVRNAAQRQIFSGDKAVPGTGTNTLGRQVAGNVAQAATVATGAELGGPGGAVGAAPIGAQIKSMFVKPNLSRDALIQRAFSNTGNAGPVYPQIPETPSARGLLNAPATPLGAAPDTSYVRGVPAQAQTPIRLALPPGNANAIPLGPSPDTSGITVGRPRSVIVRDPATGRFKRIYTTEFGGSQ